MKRAISILMGLALSTSALAGDSEHPPWDASNIYDGAKLFVAHGDNHDPLSDEQKQAVLWTYGWLVGVGDTLEASGISGRGMGLICPPQPPSPADLAHAYINYADSHPDALKSPAVSVLADALRQKYPCK